MFSEMKIYYMFYINDTIFLKKKSKSLKHFSNGWHDMDEISNVWKLTSFWDVLLLLFL